MIIDWVAYQEGKRIPSRDAMQAQFGFHELAVEDARHGHQRPKIEEYGGSLLVVLHTLEAEGEKLVSGEVDVFVGANYLLSVRQGTQRGFADVRARCERQPDHLKHRSGFFLYALMDTVVDRYFPILQSTEDRLEACEEKIFAESTGRASVESTGKLEASRVPPVCAGMQEHFRDVHDHLSRIKQSIESQREMVTAAMNVNLSLISLQENETTKRLAAYGALVGVPTLIAGLYGMNFQNMPELTWAYGYPTALAIMLAIDTWLFVRLRRAGWL
jgi:magnesium transporter